MSRNLGPGAARGKGNLYVALWRDGAPFRFYAPLPLGRGICYFDSGMAHAYVKTGLNRSAPLLSVCAGAGIRQLAGVAQVEAGAGGAAADFRIMFI